MGQVRFLTEGPYTPAPGEHLLQLQNTGDVPLYIGIRNGEYMIAPPAGASSTTTYVLTQEQRVRLQQQIQLQATYREWIASGLLTLAEVADLPAPAADEPEPVTEPGDPDPDADTDAEYDAEPEPSDEPVTEPPPPPMPSDEPEPEPLPPDPENP